MKQTNPSPHLLDLLRRSQTWHETSLQQAHTPPLLRKQRLHWIFFLVKRICQPLCLPKIWPRPSFPPASQLDWHSTTSTISNYLCHTSVSLSQKQYLTLS